MDLQKALNIFEIKDLDGMVSKDLKNLYRNHAKSKHPDQGGKTSDFIDLKEAYLLLQSKVKKAEISYTSEKLIKSTHFDISLEKLSKEEIIDKYHDVKLKLTELELAFNQEVQILGSVQQKVQCIVQNFEEEKKRMQKDLDEKIASLENKLSPSLLKRILFFLPKMSEDEFWENYNLHIQNYTVKTSEMDIEFFKEMLSVYGEGLNSISGAVVSKIKD